MSKQDELVLRRCKPCEGGVPPLPPDAVAELMRALDPAWQLAPDGKRISRTFEFASYLRTIAFVNALAWIAEAEGHHPDLQVHYGKVVCEWWTHAIGGLSENDFICAAKTDRLLA